MRRRIRAWVALWAAVMLAAVLLHAQTWNVLVPSRTDVEWLKPIANLLWTPCSPFSAFFWLTGFGASLGTWPTWLVSAGLGWGGVIGALAALDAMRRRVSLPRTPAHTVVPSGGEPGSISRRGFIVNTGSAAACLGAAAVHTHATAFEPQNLVVRRYRVRIAGLAPELHGLRIVNLSDCHAGPTVTAGYLKHAVRRAIDLAPDIFVLTGDQIESRAGRIEERAALFAPLTHRSTGAIAVLGVMGNHDWYGDGPAVREAHSAIGIRLLDNTRIFLNPLTRRIEDEYAHPQSLCIAGLGDLLMDRTDVAAAVRDVPDHLPRILLAHQPDTLEEHDLRLIPGGRIDLALCGHTHGGQVRLPLMGPPIIPSRFGQRYEGGFCQSPVGPVIVSRGVGTSGIPVRIGVPPELVEVTLVAESMEPNEKRPVYAEGADRLQD